MSSRPPTTSLISDLMAATLAATSSVRAHPKRLLLIRDPILLSSSSVCSLLLPVSPPRSCGLTREEPPNNASGLLWRLLVYAQLQVCVAVKAFPLPLRIRYNG